MWRTTLKSIGAHKRRLLGTCTAVLLGVAFLSGTLVLGDTMTEGFGDMFTEANAGTDAVVRSATEVGEADFAERGLIDRSLVDEVAGGRRRRRGRAPDRGQRPHRRRRRRPARRQRPARHRAATGSPTTPSTPTTCAEGRAPEAPGEVVIDKAAAEQGDLAVGDTTTVRTPEPIPVTIVGLATFGDADSQGPITYARFTHRPGRRPVHARPGRGVEHRRLGGRARRQPGRAGAAHRRRAPRRRRGLTGAELTAEMEDGIQDDFLGFFETFLLVFAGIALVVATFSIYNTFSILVAQRTRESALLRALGASRGQVLRSIAVEALVVGLVASVGGIVVGLGLASGLLALMGAHGHDHAGLVAGRRRAARS